MPEIIRRGASAVAIIETPDSFIAEGRPNIPGGLIHPGKVGLFGGHVERHQEPYDAILAELEQEVNLQPPQPVQFLQSGDFRSYSSRGERIIRNVSLFRVAIASVTELELQVPGTIVEIPRTIDGVMAHKNALTPYTFQALSNVVTHQPHAVIPGHH